MSESKDMSESEADAIREAGKKAIRDAEKKAFRRSAPLEIDFEDDLHPSKIDEKTDREMADAIRCHKDRVDDLRRGPTHPLKKRKNK